MALKAGRVGVRIDQVDLEGRIKESGGLSPQDRAKLDKALVIPSSQLTSNELVGVGSGNEQIRVRIGDGVKITGVTSPYTLESELDTISDVWDSTKTYSVGSYCIYNNALWKCLQENTNITPSNNDYWEKTSVTNEFIEVNTDLSELGTELHNRLSNTVRVSTYDALYDTYKTAMMPVYVSSYGGDAFLIQIYRDSDYGVQIRIPFGGGTSQKRIKNKTWGSWTNI